ncbi:ABC transporter substrate-binding protein [Nocardia higoensis]|uniref:ABC transporter substrate-binding protein n=1 Tax=Nocardia higoensis TaxID=228599 RepID=UPI0002E288D3|nr:extracellular solute-binding protein [Nocardia higoensis]
MARSFRTAAVIGAAVLALAGCGGSTEVSRPVSGSWEDVVAAANDESAVTLYSTQAQPILADLEKAFEAAYPSIDLTVVRGVDSDLLSRIDAESRTGRGSGDVAVITDVPWMRAASDTDLAVEIIGPNFQAAEYRPDESIDNGKFFLEGAVVLGFGWNTALYPKGITTAQDLLDPALRGKVGIVTPATSPTYIDYYDHIEQNYGGREFLQRLADNNPRIYPSTQPLGQALASGEITAALMSNPMLPERAAGAPLDWTAGPKVWGAKWYGLALGSAPHPNAAQVLANFMVSREGQQVTSVGFGAALPDIEGSIAVAQDVGEQNLEVTTGAGAEKYRSDWDQIFYKK